MKFSNIKLGENVTIDPSTSFNNVVINNNVKIAKRCSIFGGEKNPVEIDSDSYVGMNTIINGLVAKVTIGKHVSIAQNVNIMADSGPNASKQLQHIFPIEKGEIHIADHCWIGTSAIVMPNVVLEKYTIVAANSYVNKSFPAYSIIGGSPAKLIRKFTNEEIEKLNSK